MQTYVLKWMFQLFYLNQPTNLGALSFRLRNLMSLCNVTSRDLESEILLYDYIFTSDY